MKNKFRKTDAESDSLIKKISKLQDSIVDEILLYLFENLEFTGNDIKTSVKNIGVVNSMSRVEDKIKRSLVADFFLDVLIGFESIFNATKEYFNDIEEKDFSTEFDKQTDFIFGLFGADRKKKEFFPGTPIANKGDMKEIYTSIRIQAMAAVSSGQSFKQFKEFLNANIKENGVNGTIGNHFMTIANTEYARFDRTASFKLAETLGYRAGIYQGGEILLTRDFCLERDGKVFDKTEIILFGTGKDTYGGYIDANGNFKGKWLAGNYNPYTDCGCYNCRHYWDWIPNALAIRLRPDIEPLFLIAA